MEVINAKDYVKDSENKVKQIYKLITQVYRNDYKDTESESQDFPISPMPILNCIKSDIDYDWIISLNHNNKSEDQYTKMFVTILKTSPIRYLKMDIKSKSLSSSMYNFSIDQYNSIRVANVDYFYNILEGGERTKNYWNDMLYYFLSMNQILYYKLFSIDLSYIEAVNDSINSFLSMDAYLDMYIQGFFSKYFQENLFSEYMEYVPGPVKLKPRCLVKLKEYKDEELELFDQLNVDNSLNIEMSKLKFKKDKNIDKSSKLFKIRTPIIFHLKDKLRGSVTLYPLMRTQSIIDRLHRELISIDIVNDYELGDERISIKFWYCKNSFITENKKHKIKESKNILNYIYLGYNNIYIIIQILFSIIYSFNMSMDVAFGDNDSSIIFWSLSFLDWIYYYIVIILVNRLYEYLYGKKIISIEPFENHYKDIKYYYLIKRYKMFSIFELQLIDQEYINYKKKVHKHYSNIRDINFVNEEEDLE